MDVRLQVGVHGFHSAWKSGLDLHVTFSIHGVLVRLRFRIPTDPVKYTLRRIRGTTQSIHTGLAICRAVKEQSEQ